MLITCLLLSLLVLEYHMTYTIMGMSCARRTREHHHILTSGFLKEVIPRITANREAEIALSRRKGEMHCRRQDATLKLKQQVMFLKNVQYSSMTDL